MNESDQKEKKLKHKKTANRARSKTPKKKGDLDFSWKKLGILALTLVVLSAWAAISFILSGFVMSAIATLIFGADFYNNNILTSIYSMVYYVLAAFVAILPPLILERKYELKNNKNFKPEKGEIRTRLGLRGLPTWTDIGLAPIGLIISLLLSSGLTMIFEFFPWFNTEESQELIFSVSTSTTEKILIFIPLVIFAPIVEELIFRGWLYGKMREKCDKKMSKALSIIIPMLFTSIVFGLIHGQWNVGITVFTMSVIMCGIREITGTIYSGILIHMLKNGVAFFLIYIIGIM